MNIAGACIFVGLAILALLAFGVPAKAQDSEWVKQVLRLEYTTFCATVKKPPPQLVDAINEAMKQDPKTWMPVVIWFNAIAEKYQKAGCGDA